MIRGLARPAEAELIAYALADGVLRVGYYADDIDGVLDDDVNDPTPFADVQAWQSISAWWATDSRTRCVRFAPDFNSVVVHPAPPTSEPLDMPLDPPFIASVD